MTWPFVLGEWVIACLLWWLGMRFGSFTEAANRGTEKLTDAINLATVIQEQQEIITAEGRDILAENRRILAELKRLKEAS